MADTRTAGNWKGDLPKNLREFNKRINGRMTAVMAYEARRMESHAKKNAKWTDRTGNARNGLRAQSFVIPEVSYQIILFHQVPYGIWLEVRFNGRLAIIMPTVQWGMQDLGIMLNRLFSSLGGSA